MKKKKLIIGVSAGVLALAAAIAVMIMFLPVALVADGKTVFVVKDKATAKAVVQEVLTGYIPEDTIIKSVSLDKEATISKVNPIQWLGDRSVMTKEEAIEALTVDSTETDAVVNATITSENVKEETYTPDITYKKDEEMFAGQSRVEKEGSDGVRNVTFRYTTVNGQLTNKEIVDTEIIEEGESAIIYKGTLGLPEGEDWQTYKGDPVLSSGDDIVTSALQHLGSPYKYGGYSFVTGIDCVQYVRAIYKMYGINLPNNHPGIRKAGKGVSLKNAKPGDIVCYKHHVAIYIGNGKVADATRKRGTDISKVKAGKIITIRHIGN